MQHIDFSKIFHKYSKDHGRGHPPIPEDPATWPEEWKTIVYKTYPRLDKIVLPTVPPPQRDLFETIRSRRSRHELSDQGVTLKDLSLLLKYSCGITATAGGKKNFRAHPSGGGRFPLEIYPLVLKSAPDLPSGVYHYGVHDHELDVLWKRDFSGPEIDRYFLFDWVKRASVVFIVTGVFRRSQIKYGDRGYRYVLLEAGHLGQNVCLTSEALGIQCNPLAGTADTLIEQLLDIDGQTESVVYAVSIFK